MLVAQTVPANRRQEIKDSEHYDVWQANGQEITDLSSRWGATQKKTIDNAEMGRELQTQEQTAEDHLRENEGGR